MTIFELLLLRYPFKQLAHQIGISSCKLGSVMYIDDLNIIYKIIGKTAYKRATMILQETEYYNSIK